MSITTPADAGRAPLRRAIALAVDNAAGGQLPSGRCSCATASCSPRRQHAARRSRSDALRGWVRFAEGHGFDLAMLSDHVAPTPDVTAQYPSSFYDPFTTLEWVAGLAVVHAT